MVSFYLCFAIFHFVSFASFLEVFITLIFILIISIYSHYGIFYCFNNWWRNIIIQHFRLFQVLFICQKFFQSVSSLIFHIFVILSSWLLYIFYYWPVKVSWFVLASHLILSNSSLSVINSSTSFFYIFLYYCIVNYR